MKTQWIVIALVTLSGCATSNREVNCNWRLKPINAPATAVTPKSNAALSKTKITDARTEAPAQ